MLALLFSKLYSVALANVKIGICQYRGILLSVLVAEQLFILGGHLLISITTVKYNII